MNINQLYMRINEIQNFDRNHGFFVQIISSSLSTDLATAENYSAPS